MPQVVRLRDEVYHKEEALWLARKEIRDSDEHIQIMQQEFDTMAHEFNDLQQLLIQLEAQAADAAPERKPDHAKGTLGMQKDKSESNVETGGQRMPSFRYMPSPPKTPGHEGVLSPLPPRPNAPLPSSQTSSPPFSPATERQLQEEDVQNLKEQQQIMLTMQAQTDHRQTDPSQSATMTKSTMAPVSPDVIRPTRAAPVGNLKSGDATSGPHPLLPPGWMHVL
jgi:hypothetical protein